MTLADLIASSATALEAAVAFLARRLNMA